MDQRSRSRRIVPEPEGIGVYEQKKPPYLGAGVRASGKLNQSISPWRQAHAHCDPPGDAPPSNPPRMDVSRSSVHDSVTQRQPFFHLPVHNPEMCPKPLAMRQRPAEPRSPFPGKPGTFALPLSIDQSIMDNNEFSPQKLIAKTSPPSVPTLRDKKRPVDSEAREVHKLRGTTTVTDGNQSSRRRPIKLGSIDAVLRS